MPDVASKEHRLSSRLTVLGAQAYFVRLQWFYIHNVTVYVICRRSIFTG
jgi:hypothetical protein